MSITRQDSVALMKGMSGMTSADMVELTGYYTPGDGGGGEFYWDSSSSLADNGGTVIQPSSAPPSGRWKRVFSGPVDVRWFGALGNGTTDDTAAITLALNFATSGEIIFGYGGTYLISGTLNLSHPVAVNMNNCTITFAGTLTSSTYAFTVAANNVSIKNGTIFGNNLANTAGITSTGGFANLVMDRMTVQTVQGYGINVTNVSNLRVTNCNFIDTGNTSLSSLINTSASDGGGFIDGNIFNRSDIDHLVVTAPCVSIAGYKSPTTGAITTISNWIFTNNKILVPATPTDPSADCLEINYMLKSTVGNNTFSGGSIGLNMIACNSITASKNSFYNCVCGIEVTTSGSNHILDSNVIDCNNQATSTGVKLNGTDNINGANHNTVSNHIISNVASACIQLNNYADSNSVIGGILIYGSASATAGAVDVAGAKRTLISAVILNGNNTGINGVYLDSSITGFQTKDTIINGCVFNNFTNAVNVYYPGGGSVTGLRITNNVSNGAMFTASSAANIVTPYYYGNSPEIIGSKVILGTTGAGSSPSTGTAKLVSGTVPVSNNLVTANSEIFFSVSAVSGTPGILSYTPSPGSGFTITSSSSLDGSTISWIIVN